MDHIHLFPPPASPSSFDKKEHDDGIKRVTTAHHMHHTASSAKHHHHPEDEYRVSLSFDDEGVEVQQQRRQQQQCDDESASPLLHPAVKDLLGFVPTLGGATCPMAPQQESLYHQALCLQESTSGFYSEGTCQVHYQMAWHYYQRCNYWAALTHFLSSLKISMELDHYNHNQNDQTSNGRQHAAIEDSLTTLVLMDDIQDLLDDMGLQNQYVNRVVESWDLQDEAHAMITTCCSRDGSSKSAAIAMEEVILQRALAILPLDLDMERAHVFVRLAQNSQRQSKIEASLSYYCQALLILPQWLTSAHRQVLDIQRQTQVLVAQLTPMKATTAATKLPVTTAKADSKPLVLKPRLSRRASSE